MHPVLTIVSGPIGVNSSGAQASLTWAAPVTVLWEADRTLMPHVRADIHGLDYDAGARVAV